MPARQYHPEPRQAASLPLLWLLSDERNDGTLAQTLAALPKGSGFVFRHYHLATEQRAHRYTELAALARAHGHTVIVGGEMRSAAPADGVYGSPAAVSGKRGLRIVTAHDGEELARAVEAGADGVFLSPVFPTRSHPQAQTLGVHGFHVLAQQAPVPVIALGGMTRARAAELDWPRWGAIDGLGSPQER